MWYIFVSFHATVSTLKYLDEAKAKAAYDKLKQALDGYKIFKNDRGETVEVEQDEETGGVATFRLERMDSVVFSSEQSTAVTQATIDIEKRQRAMYEGAGVPYPEHRGH